MEKLKKFIREHHEEIITQVALIAVSTGLAYVVYKYVEGQQIESGDHYVTEDGWSIMTIHLKNGNDINLGKPPGD